MTKFNDSYWENRYQNNQIGWDTGCITPPLKAYIDQLSNTNLSILVPGAGNGYEFDYLIDKGFKNTMVVDIAALPIKKLQNKHPDFKNQIQQHNFFNIEGQFDLILEQTFFCALDPSLRKAYVDKMYQILKPKGKLAGLLFNFPLESETPPFGGSEEEYLDLFEEKFQIKTLEIAYNSIKPRADKELFFIFEKK